MILNRSENLSEYLKTQHNLDNTVSGVDYRKSQTSWEKSQFRKSHEWLSFCEKMLYLRNHQCEICNTSENLIVHHKDPIRYKRLINTDDFAVLCNKCHLKVEANCKSQELMDAHPEYKKWYTYYPYTYDAVKWQSGHRTIKRWDRERRADINKPETIVNVKQRNEALQFMKDHPELFE